MVESSFRGHPIDISENSLSESGIFEWCLNILVAKTIFSAFKNLKEQAKTWPCFKEYTDALETHQSFTNSLYRNLSKFYIACLLLDK